MMAETDLEAFSAYGSFLRQAADATEQQVMAGISSCRAPNSALVIQYSGRQRSMVKTGTGSGFCHLTSTSGRITLSLHIYGTGDGFGPTNPAIVSCDLEE